MAEVKMNIYAEIRGLGEKWVGLAEHKRPDLRLRSLQGVAADIERLKALVNQEIDQLQAQAERPVKEE